MADHVIYRCAYRLWKTTVVQRGRYRIEVAGYEVVAQLI